MKNILCQVFHPFPKKYSKIPKVELTADIEQVQTAKKSFTFR
ncbi:MAG: hypothetical protein Greene041614_740 [Parcubacteria group bacterium Greene0416_14]|nr:MAG: hypothetical protein Greene041614_740 [Parcubacteria group bacterium Greene0416_14]